MSIRSGRAEQPAREHKQADQETSKGKPFHNSSSGNEHLPNFVTIDLGEPDIAIGVFLSEASSGLVAPCLAYEELYNRKRAFKGQQKGKTRARTRVQRPPGY